MQCLVFGAVGVGKSTLLAGLAGQQSPSGTPGAAGGGAGRQSQPTAAGRVDIGGEHEPGLHHLNAILVFTSKGKALAPRTAMPPNLLQHMTRDFASCTPSFEPNVLLICRWFGAADHAGVG